MNNVKRDKKKEVVKPTEDCSCTSSSSDSSSTDCTSHSSREEKCDPHCTVKRVPGKVRCIRKCKTVCVKEFTQDVNYEYKWDYKTVKYSSGKCEPEPIPKKCDEKHDKSRDDKKEKK